MPRECPRIDGGPNVLELLFDSDPMLLVGRLLIATGLIVMLACALFVLASIAVRMRRGHWLRRAGPFEVSDTTAGAVDHGTEVLKEKIGEQRRRIAALEMLLDVWTGRPVDTDDKGDS